jgi:hypothetical protein
VEGIEPTQPPASRPGFSERPFSAQQVLSTRFLTSTKNTAPLPAYGPILVDETADIRTAASSRGKTKCLPRGARRLIHSLPPDPFRDRATDSSLKSSLGWRKKRQAAVPVQAAQQDMSGFPDFRASHSNTRDNCL